MDQMFILITAGLTSVGICLVGVKVLRFSWSGLWPALGQACECIGLTGLFFLINVTVSIIAILAARVLMGRFFSLYAASDTTLLVLALFQALAFREWHASSRRVRTRKARDNAPCSPKP
jgi:hypothetical protein